MPVPLMEPTPAGEMDQVMEVFSEFVTVAVNCWDCPPYNVAEVGETVTPSGGDRVTVAGALFVPSAWLVAITLTVCCVATVDGAVYRPEAVTVPMPAGLSDQVTAVLLALPTVAENC